MYASPSSTSRSTYAMIRSGSAAPAAAAAAISPVTAPPSIHSVASHHSPRQTYVSHALSRHGWRVVAAMATSAATAAAAAASAGVTRFTATVRPPCAASAAR